MGEMELRRSGNPVSKVGTQINKGAKSISSLSHHAKLYLLDLLAEGSRFPVKDKFC